MKYLKFFSMVCLIGIGAIYINSCSKSDGYSAPAGGGGGGSDSYAVTIQAMQFQPATVTVLLGSKITWTNMDADTHTVTSDDGTSFNSGNIASQGTYSFTANNAGTYPYHCTLHPMMQGTLVVITR